MKVAFMLVATAWLAGADDGKPVAAPAQPAQPKVVATPAPGWNGGGYGSGCCSTPSCDSCCESDCGHRHGLLSKLRGLFHRNKDCCDTGCDTGCGHGHHKSHSNCCQPVCQPTCVTTCNDCCDDGCGKHRLFGKLRGLLSRFHHKNDCCDDGCNTCGNGSYGGGYAAPYGAPRGAEPIQGPKEPPKAMPSGAPAKTSQLSPAPRLEPAPAPKIGFGSNTGNGF